MTQNPYFEALRAIAGPQVTLKLERDIAVQDAEGLGVTFSPEAMNAINEQMATWVGTRLLRFATDHGGIMPQSMKVTINVELHA